jgi:nicotinate-nucleotide adenylyltransferase
MRLGIFGGTFDPPHLGHLILAAEAADQLALERVLWVLTPNSPFKLLQAAIADLPGHVFSDVEIRRPAPQYALDTVLQLKQDFPRDELIYLVGGDSLRDLPRWHRPQELVGAVDGFGVMRRPGARIRLPALEASLPGLTAKVHWMNAPLIQISASDIRQRVREGRTYRFFVPEKVFQIIQSRKYYR